MALGVETLFDRNRFWALVLFPVCILGNCLQLVHLRFPRFMYSADSSRLMARLVSESNPMLECTQNAESKPVDFFLVDGPSWFSFWATNPDWTFVAWQGGVFRCAELRVNGGAPFIESIRYILGEVSRKRYASAFVIFTIQNSTRDAEVETLHRIEESGFHYTAITNDSVVLVKLNAR